MVVVCAHIRGATWHQTSPPVLFVKQRSSVLHMKFCVRHALAAREALASDLSAGCARRAGCPQPRRGPRRGAPQPSSHPGCSSSHKLQSVNALGTASCTTSCHFKATRRHQPAEPAPGVVPDGQPAARHLHCQVVALRRLRLPQRPGVSKTTQYSLLCTWRQLAVPDGRILWLTTPS